MGAVRLSAGACRIEGVCRMTFGRRWKAETMKHCELHGTRRAVLGALVLVADWKGRSHRPYRELAKIAGCSPRSCASALHYLTKTGFVLIEQPGSGRRPTWLQVVPYEPAIDPVVVQPSCTKTFSVVVQS